MPRLSADGIRAYLARHFPGATDWTTIEEVADDRVRVRMPFRREFLRPGGTQSGPTLMALADTAMYFLVLSHIGERDALTSSLEIHFLRRPPPNDLVAEARLLKLGRRSAVGAVELTVDGTLVAHATVTYAIPPLPEEVAP